MPFISGYAVNQASTFPPSLAAHWAFEDWFVQVPVPRAKTVFKCQPKGKISNYDFECIDPALKHRLTDPFQISCQIPVFSLVLEVQIEQHITPLSAFH